MLATATERSPTNSIVDHAVARLDAWLETMRGARGYGGPVTHWRQQSLIYTGPGRDWRYEGIIAGYLELWRRSGAQIWLDRARRAGDDLLGGQQANGHFAASAFESNPAIAGSPHEAACDVGLLLLARALSQVGDSSWQIYAGCAEQNLRGYYISQLWDANAGSFREHQRLSSFVANKAATVCEALFLMSELRGEDVWGEHYALPTLNAILGHQVTDDGPLEGAIAQNSYSGRPVETYYPLFIARCIPALLQGYERTGVERYLDGAARAMAFIERWVGDSGALPLIIRGDEQISPEPHLVAPLGDVLRAADLLAAYGVHVDLGEMRRRLLDGQDASGGICLAAEPTGARRTRRSAPDFRDALHVAGWCDKAFRYLAAHTGPALPSARSETVISECVIAGWRVELEESAEALEVRHQGKLRYRWRKGHPWAEVAEKEFWRR
ncbi:hypothetical protein K2Z83_02950 [Oscillochloris sp. ZM17-4]|uniref:hypothetical protein n=1 Tax=Oscillochloris sp. ZM17-4 TaxID=2866714 RepID=UPI001C72F44D|nr:hypothetical protein [Oscillochloris sp. ZM17-4]MBX0326640.1 hypothetical protein [Oscillochloris sp. ZM17-4]